MSNIFSIMFGLLATAVVYGALPILLALLLKKPIEKSSYKWICIGYICVLAFIMATISFSVGITEANFAPACFWGIISYMIGRSILSKRNLLIED